MKRIFLVCFVAICCFCSPVFAQSGRWIHQIGVEIGPQYVFNATVKAADGQTRTLQDVGVGLGAAVNYYYQFDRALFLSVSGVVGYFANGYFRLQNADGSFPVVNSYYFKNNALLNLALTAGLRYNFTVTGVQPYVGLEFGSYTVGGIPREDNGTAINLAATPKLGVRIPLQPGLNFDASAKLMYMFSGYVPFSYASINAGVSYSLSYAND